MATESRTPPTEICNVPVPTMAVAPAELGAELKLAAVAKFCTAIEYWPVTALDVAVAVAMVASPTVAVRPASCAGSCKAVNVAWKVESALLKVPQADTCAFSAVLLRLMALVKGAAFALVNDVTIAAMSSPDPTP